MTQPEQPGDERDERLPGTKAVAGRIQRSAAPAPDDTTSAPRSRLSRSAEQQAARHIDARVGRTADAAVTSVVASTGVGAPVAKAAGTVAGRLTTRASGAARRRAGKAVVERVRGEGSGTPAGTEQADRRRGRRGAVRSRLADAATRGVPGVARVRRAGKGNLISGLEFFATRNPLYAWLLRLLPFEGKAKTSVAAGCGCVSGCGCGLGCCSFAGCFLPFIILMLVVVGSWAFVSSQPQAAQAVWCEVEELAVCDGTPSLSLSIDDVPPGLITEYQRIEAETGVPWFYLAAWEKVATDFGRREELPGRLEVAIPPEATRAANSSTAAAVDGITDPDSDEQPTSEAARQRAADAARQLLAERADLIDRLRSNLRDGAWGLMLVNRSEWQAYGLGPGGHARDAWNRSDAGMMIALHVRDVGERLIQQGQLTYHGAPMFDTVSDEMAAYLTDLLDAPSHSEDQFLSGLYRETIFGGMTETWDRGPRDGEAVTDAERYFVCQARVTPEDLGSGACDDFLVSTDTTTIGDRGDLADSLAAVYDPAGGAAVDWDKLRIVMGAILSDDELWGMERQALYTTQGVGYRRSQQQASPAASDSPDGDDERERRGEVTYNLYAEAINMYAESLYTSWDAARQMALAAGNGGEAGALNRVDAPALRFWKPSLLAAEAETGVPWEILAAVIDADGGFGCEAYGEVDPANTVTPSAIAGCWWWGEGTASTYGTPTVEGVRYGTGPDSMGVAMNFCTWQRRHTSGCGTVDITSLDTGRTVEDVPVIDFCDCWINWTPNRPSPHAGESARIVDLTDSVVSALGMSPASFGLSPVRVSINPPDAASPSQWPPIVRSALEADAGASTPAATALELARELRSLAGLDGNAATTLVPLLPGIVEHAPNCVIDRSRGEVKVTDPYDPELIGQTPTCDYLERVITDVNLYVAFTRLGEEQQTAVYGIQPSSRYGYIWPLVGVWITSGFEPRGLQPDTLWVSPGAGGAARSTLHDGADLSPASCVAPVVAANSGYLSRVTGLTEWYFSGGRLVSRPAEVLIIEHADGLTSGYAHIAIDPAIARQLNDADKTVLSPNGKRAIVVNRGDLIASTQRGSCHLHFSITRTGSTLPASDAFFGGHSVRMGGSYGEIRLDPISLLPKVEGVIKPGANGRLLPNFYYNAYPATEGWPIPDPGIEPIFDADPTPNGGVLQ